MMREWWRGAVLYQVYPRSFADTTGDGVGDLNGVTAHLDHIASLGVDGIWLSPFFTSLMKDFGYDVSNYCDVDPVFGTLADFDRLIERAHALVDPEAIANWPQTLGRDGARTPMPWSASAPFAGFSTAEPWLPIDVRHPPLAVDAQEADPGSMLHVTRRLVALRRAHPALRLGTMTVQATEPLLILTRENEREGGGERLMGVFNLGHETVDWSPPPGWSVIEAVNGAKPARLAPLAGLLLRAD